MAALLKPLFEGLIQFEAAIARSWASAAHHRLMRVQWAIPPQPEHFDHQIDLFYQWLSTRSSFWVERGAFGSLALKGDDLLELACGDGFNARNFYSLRSRFVVACDFDPKAIRTALCKNCASNIRFVLADIRNAMPSGVFANVVWDAAIEHFTPTEIAEILSNIKSRLTEDGILSGYTIVEQADGVKMLTHHEYEFKSKEDLLAFLKPDFRNIAVFETAYPTRRNLYFWASDGAIPFSNDWPSIIVSHRGSG